MRPQTQSTAGMIGLGIGFLGFCIGMYFTFRASPWIGSLVTFFGLVIFGSFIFIPLMKDRKEKKLLATGIKAKGKILELWDTGVTINNSPQIGMVVEVFPASGTSFKSKLTMLISRLDVGNFKAGIDCTVLYDPDNTKNIMIESVG